MTDPGDRGEATQEPSSAPPDSQPLAVESPPAPPAPPPAPANYWGSPEPQHPVRPAPGWEYVGFWRRAVAFFVDGIVLTIVSYAILIPFFLTALSSADISAFQNYNGYTIDPATGRVIPSPEMMAAMSHVMGQLFAGLGLVFLAQGAYFVILWSIRGASLGQLILGVEIRNEADGRRIGFWRACLRYVGFLISGWALLLGFIWVAVDARKQGWHDKIAGTLVVRNVG